MRLACGRCANSPANLFSRGLPEEFTEYFVEDGSDDSVKDEADEDSNGASHLLNVFSWLPNPRLHCSRTRGRLLPQRLPR